MTDQKSPIDIARAALELVLDRCASRISGSNDFYKVKGLSAVEIGEMLSEVRHALDVIKRSAS